MLPTVPAFVLLCAVSASPGGAGEAPDEPLAPFFEALSSLEAGAGTASVRVGWFGDSAIVSDGYTSEVRERLQARFGDGGPGFVLASPAFEGYRREGLSHRDEGWDAESVLRGRHRDGRYGYGGVVAESWGGATTTLALLESATGVNRVLVYYRAAPKAGTLSLHLDGARAPTLEQSTAADEDGDAVWRADLPAAAHEVRLRVSGGRARVYGLALERSGPGVVLDALGVVGLRARRWRHADAAHIARQVAQRELGLVVLNFGGNERVDPGLNAASHEAEILEVLALLRRPAELPCLIVGPVAHGEDRAAGDLDVDPALTIIYEAQRTAAARAGCGFYDTIAAMGGAGAVREYRRRRLLGGDLAHLNGKGHRVVGEAMATWLLERYDRWAAPAGQAVAPPSARDDGEGASGGAQVEERQVDDPTEAPASQSRAPGDTQPDARSPAPP